VSREIAEWLALGTAHPVDPANVGRSTGPARWEFADAGWALAGLPNHIAWLLRAKYMGEPSMPGLIVEVVDRVLVQMATWRRIHPQTKPKHVREVVEAATHIFCARDACTVCNAQECPVCKGKDDMLCDYCCAHCGGTGLEPYSSWKQMVLSASRGPHADMTRLYDEVMAMLSRWEGKGLRLVWRRIRRDKVKVNSQVRQP